MQSIYWVLTWACHRKCKHCYDDRFRPYVRDALTEVVGEGQKAYHKIIENLPDDLSWVDNEGKRQRSTLILAGGELLIDGVREELFYPVLKTLKAKYADAMPRISIQTTGDILTEQILDEVLDRGVDTIGIASIDDYHVGMKGEKKYAFMRQVRELMESRGVKETDIGLARQKRLKTPDHHKKTGPEDKTFLFFGAQPELWIGELWPRGRALQNGLSKASYDTNFCARWSGGKNFLNLGHEGSEIAIEPNGNLYPCCLKTKAPLGNLTEEKLEDILSSVGTLPEIQAINDGDPEGMAKAGGWTREAFKEKSKLIDGKGNQIQNMCLGCDVFFTEILGQKLQDLRKSRLQAA